MVILLPEQALADRLLTRCFSDEGPMGIELAKTESFELGGLSIQPRLRTVRSDEQSATLEPRVMQVLVLLARHAEQPVDRDTMVGECWDGVIVGDDAIQRCIGRLRRLASQLGGFSIETIPKIGYRLVPEGSKSKPFATPREDEQTPAPARLAFAAATFRGHHEGGADFAQLLSNDVATALSVNRDLIVLTGDGQPNAEYFASIELRESGESFQVRCVLTGPPDGRIVWSDSISLDHGAQVIEIGIPADDLVIDIAGKISAVLLREVTESSLAQPQAQSAWQAVVRANSAYQRIDFENLETAIVESRRAIELDPTYAAAHAALANALAAHFEIGGGQNEDQAEEARAACDMALALAPEDATVLAWTASAIMMITLPAEGLALAEKAVALDPSSPVASLYLARHYINHGRAEDAEHALDQHERVAPLFPWKYFPKLIRGLARFMLGDVDGAQKLMQESAMLNPKYPYSWISLMVIGALKSDVDVMRNSAAKLKQIDGEDSLDLQLARILRSYPDPAQAAMVQTAFKTAWEA